MKAKLASLALMALMLTGCATAPGTVQTHPDLNVEMVIKLLDDIDQILTNYAWLIPLLGL